MIPITRSLRYSRTASDIVAPCKYVMSDNFVCHASKYRVTSVGLVAAVIAAFGNADGVVAEIVDQSSWLQ